MDGEAPRLPPIDFDAIEKGRVFTARELIAMTGQAPGTNAYSRDATRIGKAIEGARPDLTTTMDGDELHVLEDGRASQHNGEWFNKYIRRAKYRNERMQAVDTGNLSDRERATHGRRLVRQGAILAGIAAAGRPALQAVPVQRRTPGLESA